MIDSWFNVGDYPKRSFVVTLFRMLSLGRQVAAATSRSGIEKQVKYTIDIVTEKNLILS